METQNLGQLIEENLNELSENFNLPEPIAVNENDETLDNSSLEPSLEESNTGTIAQKLAGLPNQLQTKEICWDPINNVPVECPRRP